MNPKFFLATALSIILFSATANAGPVYLGLILDPLTTANAGGLDGTSTQSGPGTWHLYAFDDTVGSFGIANYSIRMTGINTVFNRTPSTLWNDGEGDYDAGFRLLRTPNDTTAPVGAAANPITGSQQILGSTPIDPILGFGREASDFTTKLPAGAPVSNQTSPSWGDYATDPCFSFAGLFLAEGTYTSGSPPTISAARIQVYSNATTFSVMETEEVLGLPPVLQLLLVNNAEYFNYNANLLGEPQTLTHQFTTNIAASFTWDQLSLLSYTPNYGGQGPGPLIAPTLSSTGLFQWESEGSPRGDYVWQVRCSVNGPCEGQSDLGTITVHVTGVPEPSTIILALTALAILPTRRRK